MLVVQVAVKVQGRRGPQFNAQPKNASMCGACFVRCLPFLLRDQNDGHRHPGCSDQHQHGLAQHWQNERRTHSKHGEQRYHSIR